MEANTAMLEDALTMKPFPSCCIWRRSRQPKWNGSRKTMENLKHVHFTWVSQPCNAKNTVNTTVFDSMDGGGVNIDSINKLAGPAPGLFLAKARGTPASTASFREKLGLLPLPFVPCYRGIQRALLCPVCYCDLPLGSHPSLAVPFYKVPTQWVEQTHPWSKFSRGYKIMVKNQKWIIFCKASSKNHQELDFVGFKKKLQTSVWLLPPPWSATRAPRNHWKAQCPRRWRRARNSR